MVATVAVNPRLVAKSGRQAARIGAKKATTNDNKQQTANNVVGFHAQGARSVKAMVRVSIRIAGERHIWGSRSPILLSAAAPVACHSCSALCSCVARGCLAYAKTGNN